MGKLSLSVCLYKVTLNYFHLYLKIRIMKINKIKMLKKNYSNFHSVYVLPKDYYNLTQGSRKKVFFLVDSPLKGGGVRGCRLRKKELFLCLFVIFFILQSFFLPLRQGVGAKGLSGLSTKKERFFAASLTQKRGRDPIYIPKRKNIIIKIHSFLLITVIVYSLGIVC